MFIFYLCVFRESETTIKIKFARFRGGLGRGAGRKIVQNAIFHGKRHDNKILKVKILLSRNFVVMAQAPMCLLALISEDVKLFRIFPIDRSVFLQHFPQSC